MHKLFLQPVCPLFKYLIRVKTQKLNHTFKIERIITNLSQAIGGGVGVLDKGKLATSRPAAKDLMEPNGWSGDNCIAVGTRPLQKIGNEIQIPPKEIFSSLPIEKINNVRIIKSKTHFEYLSWIDVASNINNKILICAWSEKWSWWNNGNMIYIQL